MQKRFRLRKRKEFSRVLREGRAWTERFFVLKVMPNGLSVSRFGFVVSKRVGKAVVRNQVRRRLREATRQLPVQAGRDLVVVVRREAATASFWTLAGALRRSVEKAGLLVPSPVGPRREEP